MKTCPVCKLDYCDDFSFCEFDGATLRKTMLTESAGQANTFSNLLNHLHPLKSVLAQNLSNIRNPRLLACILFVTCFALIGSYIASRPTKSKQKKADQAKLKSENQPPIFVETPKEALDFVEIEEPAVLVVNQQASPSQTKPHDRSESPIPEKPGVKVYTQPQTTPGDINPNNKSMPSDKSLSQSQPPQGKTLVNIPNKKQLPVEPDIQNPQRPNNLSRTAYHGVSLKLLKVLPRRSQNHVSYEITLSIQNNGGRLIQWENLNVVSSNKVGQNTSTSSRFLGRLGSPGRIILTLTSPAIMPLSSGSMSSIRCSLFGKTVDNSAVAVSIVIPVQT